jgi:hypothetical protein
MCEPDAIRLLQQNKIIFFVPAPDSWRDGIHGAMVPVYTVFVLCPIAFVQGHSDLTYCILFRLGTSAIDLMNSPSCCVMGWDSSSKFMARWCPCIQYLYYARLTQTLRFDLLYSFSCRGTSAIDLISSSVLLRNWQKKEIERVGRTQDPR